MRGSTADGNQNKQTKKKVIPSSTREIALKNLEKARAAQRSGKKKSQTQTVAAIRKKVESKLKRDAKGTLGDYIRLVQLEKELEASDPAEIRAGWVEAKEAESDSAE